MDLSLYIRPFLTSFSVAVVVLTLFLRLLSGSKGYSRNALLFRRFGGIAVILAFLSAVLLDPRLVLTPEIVGILVGSGAIMAFGAWDDVAALGWKTQFAFQCFLGGVLFVSGFRIFSVPVPFVGQVFVDGVSGGAILGGAILVFWVISVMNVLNWADGIDGLLPSLSFLAFLALFFLSVSPAVNQPPTGILSVAIAGAVLGLLIFNFPPSKFLAGTSGSFFVGFSLASISVLSGAKIATAVLVLSLPILDALWVFFERLRSNRSPFQGGDARHLHYRLREMGWSDRRIVAIYTLYTGVIGGIALSSGVLGKTLILLGLSALAVPLLALIRRKTLLREEDLAKPL